MIKKQAIKHTLQNFFSFKIKQLNTKCILNHKKIIHLVFTYKIHSVLYAHQNELRLNAL